MTANLSNSNNNNHSNNNNNNNIITLTNLDASQYCWNTLWKAEEVHLKLPILDVIQFASSSTTTSKVINGWLFTATDGNVKSKSKHRWNEGAVLERCSGMNQRIGAHITDGIKWLNGNDSILHNSFSISSNIKAIVSFNHLNIQSPFFLENTYVKSEPLPKISTSLFCDSKAKGKFNEASDKEDCGIFPSYRILNMNKKISEIAKNYVLELVKAIETRERVKVTKLVTVLLHENDDRIERDTKIWLHHVNEIVYEQLHTTMNNDNDKASSMYASTKASYRESFINSDNKSVTYSEVSYGQASFHRLHKCQGDFCQYNEEEEQHQVAMEGYDGANIIEASKRVRLQFRKVTGGDIKKLAEEVSDPNAFSSTEKVDLAEREEGLDGVTIGSGAAKGKDEYDENMPQALKKTSQSRFVPYKSIALARQDMTDLEAAQETSFVHSPVPWTELLYHWYWRAGRSIIQKKGSISVPISAGHKIGVAMITNRHNSIVKKDDKSSMGNDIGMDFHHGNDSNFHTSIDDLPQGLLKKPMFKKDDDSNITNDADPQKVGQFSWYYSDARVCEHCYKVYKDLDRRRVEKQMTLLKAQKKALESNEIKRGKELEKRMFHQRKLASRLAKPIVKKVSTEPSLNIYAEPSAITDPFGDGSISQMHYSHTRKPLVGIPKGFLPPLPWNLTNPEQREYYQNAGSTFVKSLKSKADDLRELTKHEQKMKELQHIRKKMLGGMLDEESVELADSSAVIVDRDEVEEWNKATGRYRDPNSNEVVHQRPYKGNKKEIKTVDPKTFDTARLMHPWQRDLNKLREQAKKTNKKTKKKNFKSRDDDYDFDDEMNNRSEQQPSATMKTLQKFQELKSKARGKMTRSNSLPPMNPSLMQMSQITLDSNIKTTMMGGSVSNTILNGSDDYKGFTGLGRHSTSSRTEESTGNSKSLKQLQNFEKSLSKTLIHEDGNSNGVGKPVSQSSKRVLFDESSISKSNKSPSPVKSIIKYTKHYESEEEEEDDDDDDDDDDDEGIGWSPFTVAGI